MARRFEFSMHVIRREDAERGDVDASLELLGAQGWQIRGLTALAGGDVLVALQRQYSDDVALPDAPALSAALAEPLSAPSS
jgi:hypothetical protein